MATCRKGMHAHFVIHTQYTIDNVLHTQYTKGMKTSKSFRLSEQAQENLRQIFNLTGSNDTAIVEMSLAFFAKMLLSQKPATPPEPEFPRDEKLVSHRPNVVQPAQPKRKRHG
jgi:hypothetical protein